MTTHIRTALAILLSFGFCMPIQAQTKTKSSKPEGFAHDPYVGAICVDEKGTVLFEKNADARAYPASITKLMSLLVIQDRVASGQLKLDEQVAVTKEAYKIGGSQVWLEPGEQFTVEELIYAMMVQSANDAAGALAIHITGSKEGFVELMNQKATGIGMKSTHFGSVHGLPPSEGQEADVTTPRDLSLLAVELLKNPATLTYTSTKERDFRPVKPVHMVNHNKLLWSFPGCDGLKTGWTRAAGYSTATTATRGGRRVIVIVMGSLTKNARDNAATSIMSTSLAQLPAVAATNTIVVVAATNPPPQAADTEEFDPNAPALNATGTTTTKSRWPVIATIAGTVIVLLWVIGAVMRHRSKNFRDF